MFTNTLTSVEVSKIWGAAQKDLQSQLTPAVYNTWIASTPLTSVEVDQQGQALATITCPTGFHATNLQKNLYTQIKKSLESQLQKSVELSFVVGSPLATESNTSSGKKSKNPLSLAPQPSPSPTVDQLFSAHTLQSTTEDRMRAAARRIGLRPDYTFKNFAVSTTNEMAHAAATAVSNNPGAAYNPLFLYGGVGVGKTHLMHAISYNILQRNPDTNIIYRTGEEFTNEIVDAIKRKSALDFKKKYRNTQVFLVDDVQFIAGKVSVQEEFFHTFNALMKQSAQIILTSDRPPHEIIAMDSRIRSRFEAGLMIDIQQPTFELRTAILLIKAQANRIELPMEYAQQIASRVDSARQIEGIVAKLRSAVELQQEEITPQLVEKVLKQDIAAASPKARLRVKPQDVIKTVANHFRIKQSAIKGTRRVKEIVTARHAAMYIMRSELGTPLEEIGHWFSGRDHTSVLHATKKIEQQMTENSLIQQDISAIKMSLNALSKS